MLLEVELCKYEHFWHIGTDLLLKGLVMDQERAQKHFDYAYGCSVEATLDVIGGKWKGVILYHLSETRRFNELQRRIPGINRRMLTLQLRELEADGLVHREVYKQVPPKVEYTLTEFGETLTPLIAHMCRWGEVFMARVERTRTAAD